MPSWLEPQWLTCILVNGIVLAISFSVVGSVMATAFAGATNGTGPRRGGFLRGLASFGLPLLLASLLQIALLFFDGWSIYHMLVHEGDLTSHQWKWWALFALYVVSFGLCLRLPIFNGREL